MNRAEPTRQRAPREEPAPQWHDLGRAIGPTKETHAKRALRVGGVAIIAGVVPLTRVAVVFDAADAAFVAMLSMTGLLIARAIRRQPWWIRLLPAVIAGSVSVPTGGFQTGAWVAAGIVLAMWAGWQLPPISGVPVSAHATGPVAVISLVAAWRQLTSWGWAVLIITVVMSVAAIALTGRVEGLGRRVGHAAGSVVSALLFGALSIVAVVLPFIVQRVSGIDPTEFGASTKRWIPIRDHRPEPGTPWNRVLRTGRQRSLRRLVVPLVCAVGGLAWVGYIATDQPAGRRAYNLTDPDGTVTTRDIPAAYADATWYGKYMTDIDYAYTWLDGFLPIDGLGLPDFESRYLNTEGGVRRSWVPPECSCRRLTVWMYGASTIFGVGQRDDHTIASSLARAAWDRGIALDVVNRGVPSEQHWQEANRLRWDLTRSAAPDVVLFYDGASDTVGASWLNERQLGDINRPSQPLTEGFLERDSIRKVIAPDDSSPQPPKIPGGLAITPPSTVAPMSAQQVGQLAAERYGSARRMSLDLATSNELAAFWFWQPTRLSRPPVEGEPSTELDEASRRAAETAAAMIPTGVVNLSDVLDADRRPMFSDDVHHNEAGAVIIADSILAEIEPTLRAKLAQ